MAPSLRPVAPPSAISYQLLLLLLLLLLLMVVMLWWRWY
jgi:hypothetical protein